ncbi:hypothetical protein HOLleu_26973 [Holothuria leucospilota]|uniref:Ig-like domain-containing protein n=1 Tax=Holothuria leucospilota TaxID=206669 RepID=A0A9Q1H2W3_HOLLE|nr:hypothetical protein HOLleu_26973 [Holothuria leucospilota]
MVHLNESQEMIFELKEREFQEIIFSGDTNVSMVCQVSDVLAAKVTITQNSTKIVATKAGAGNCLEYTIPEVQLNDGGTYECSVTYKDMWNSSKTLQKALILNVSVRNSSCFRNGTKGSYKVDDMLLLSCYCRVAEFCVWTASVVGSQLGMSIQPFVQVEYNNKKISRVKVGPLTTSDLDVRYDCSHGPTVFERCSIGPAINSSKDLVLSPTATRNMSMQCDTTFIKKTSPTTQDGVIVNSPKNVLGSEVIDRQLDPIFFLLFPVVGIILLLFVIIIFISLLIFKSRKARRTKNTDERVLELDDQVVKTDGHAYGTETGDEYSYRYRNGNVGQETVRVANRVDGRDMKSYFGSQSQEPTGLRCNNSAYVDDVVSYADQFQSAETSDYHVPVALMRHNFPYEDDAVYAQL